MDKRGDAGSSAAGAGGAAGAGAAPDPDPGRDESAEQRLDRNTIELLNELRVISTGIQVMFAFLLIVPFNTGFKHVSQFERTDYFVTLLLIAVAAVLLMAPSVHHRLLFRHHEKPWLIRLANRIAIAAVGFIALGLTGILVLLSDVVVGGPAPLIVGAIALLSVTGLWFAVPLARRSEERPADRQS